MIYLNSVAYYLAGQAKKFLRVNIWLHFRIYSDPDWLSDWAPIYKMWPWVWWHGGECWHLRPVRNTWHSLGEGFSVWEMLLEWESFHLFIHPRSMQSKFCATWTCIFQIWSYTHCPDTGGGTQVSWRIKCIQAGQKTTLISLPFYP